MQRSTRKLIAHFRCN